MFEDNNARGFSLTRTLSFAAPSSRRGVDGARQSREQNQNQQQQQHLSRSKSLRIVTRAQQEEGSYATENNQRQATIDYLTADQVHKRHKRRSFSMRRDDGGGGGGKIALFLRKLFNLGRPSRATKQQQQQQPNRTIVHHHHTHEAANSFLDSDRAYIHATALPPPMSSYNLYDEDDLDDKYVNSPSANSLIEILDCAPSLEHSRRRLRQEQTRASSASRATWRLIERSESRLSDVTSISQQLRRHLNEAKSNQKKQEDSVSARREREFIDSINVLRQASRHASLELQSRASTATTSTTTSKTRRRKSSTTARDERKSTANTSDDASSYSMASSDAQQDLNGGDELLIVGQHKREAETNWKHSEQQLSPMSNGDHHDEWQRAPPVSHLNCCCPSLYSTPCHQLNYLPPPPPTCCGFDPMQQQLAFNATTTQPPLPDLCCPIWRSLIYSYCQQQQQQLNNVMHPPPPPTQFVDRLLPVDELQQQQQQQQKSHTFSSMTNLQQQQHNTTIDLKIEIGADFCAKKTRANAPLARLLRRPNLKSSDSDATTTTSDSMDSSSSSTARH